MKKYIAIISLIWVTQWFNHFDDLVDFLNLLPKTSQKSAKVVKYDGGYSLVYYQK